MWVKCCQRQTTNFYNIHFIIHGQMTLCRFAQSSPNRNRFQHCLGEKMIEKEILKIKFFCKFLLRIDTDSIKLDTPTNTVMISSKFEGRKDPAGRTNETMGGNMCNIFLNIFLRSLKNMLDIRGIDTYFW